MLIGMRWVWPCLWGNWVRLPLAVRIVRTLQTSLFVRQPLMKWKKVKKVWWLHYLKIPSTTLNDAWNNCRKVLTTSMMDAMNDFFFQYVHIINWLLIPLKSFLTNTFPLGTFSWCPCRVGNGDGEMSITAHDPIAQGIVVLSNWNNQHGCRLSPKREVEMYHSNFTGNYDETSL